MTSSRGDQLANEYLVRLERAAHGLPAQRRVELLAQLREHIASARAEATDQDGGSDEVAVRNAIDDLGAPEDIVAAASGDHASTTEQRAEQRTAGRSPGEQLYDIITVLLLLLGGVIVPVLGWLAGVVLLWGSRRWRIRDKALGTIVLPTGLALPLWLALRETWQTCYGGTVDGGSIQEFCDPLPRPMWITVTLLVALTIAPVIVAVSLLRRAGRSEPSDLS
jgi:hypothetical protein